MRNTPGKSGDGRRDVKTPFLTEANIGRPSGIAIKAPVLNLMVGFACGFP
jgi:hypothetical protein